MNIRTSRLWFRAWNHSDEPLAQLLWADPLVTEHISRSGFSTDEINSRLNLEMSSLSKYGVQYWPMFLCENDDFVGCCGLHWKEEGTYELGFHLRSNCWGMGYAYEAARAVIDHAWASLRAQRLFAGHNPGNVASQKLLLKLGFVYSHDEYYAGTGLMHPSYYLYKT